VYFALNRPVGGMHLLRRDAEFEAFEHDVIEALRRDPMRMLSYYVLSNHWHFVVWPETDSLVTQKREHALRANAPEWEPARRGTLETLLSEFVPPFPGSGHRNVGALPRKVSSCETGCRDDANHSRDSCPPGEQSRFVVGDYAPRFDR
jgi:hypothetical protein